MEKETTTGEKHIVFGDYRLCIDRWCMWIDHIIHVKSKKTGKEYTRYDNVSGYCPNINSLMKSFLDGTIATTKESKKIKDFVSAIDAARSAALKMIDEYIKQKGEMPWDSQTTSSKKANTTPRKRK